MAGNEVRERLSLQSCLDVLIQSVLLAFLCLAPWFYGLTRFQDKLLAEILIFSIFLVALPLLAARKDPPSGGRGSFFDGYVFLGLSLGFFYVIFSALPYSSLLAFLQLLSCAIFYGLVRGLVRTWNRFLICLYVVLALGFFYSVYGLLQYRGFLPHSYWDHPESLASRFVNGGHFGAFLLFPLFGGLSLLISTRKRAVQFILTFLLMVLGGTLLLTRARAVWLASFAGVGIFLWQAVRNQLLDRRAKSGMVFLAIGGGVLLFLGRGAEKIVQRFGELWSAVYTPLAPDKVQFYSLLYRRDLWKGTFRAIMEHPWGWGLGTFSSIYPQYRTHSDRFFVDYAHNEFLQVGTDLGIPGLLLLIGFLFLYFQRASSFLKSREVPSSRKAFGTGFISLWVSLILVSQVDFPLRIYAVGILFAAFLGLSAYLFEGPPSPRFFKKGLAVVISWFIVFAANFVTARQLLADLRFSEGKRLEANLSWKEAQGEHEKAVRLSPFFARYHEALGYLYEERAKITFDQNQRKNFIKEAIRAYREAIRHNPYRALTHYLIAMLYEAGNDFPHAQAEFLKAISLEPSNAVFVAEYRHFALRHSRVEEAITTFERVKDMPYHGEEARANFNEILKLCYRLTQDPDQLRRVIPETVSGYTSLSHLLAEDGRWDLARKEFETLAQIGKRMYDPDYRRYFDNVGRHIADFHVTHSHFREALEVYREAASMLPEDEEIKRKIEELHGHLSGT